MSNPILAQLQDPSPAVRKRGINAAAKSVDRRYLPALAQLVKSDPEPELRQLAKRAGSYIHKQSQAAAAPSSAAVAPSAAPSGAGAISADVMRQTATAVQGHGAAKSDPEQAEYHYDLAFEMHLKEDNARAALELASAFYLNPRHYATDPTAIAFAAELTGRPPVEAVAYIVHRDNWRELTDQHGGLQAAKSESGNDLSTLVLWAIAGLIALVAFGLLLNFVASDTFATLMQGTLFNATGGRLGESVVSTPLPPLLTPTVAP